MNISPGHKVIKIDKAVAGDLIFLHGSELPMLVVVEKGGGGPNKFVSLSEKSSSLEGIGQFMIEEVCLRIDDKWRFKLGSTISGRQVTNPASAEKGKVAVNEHGIFFISTLGGNVIPREAVIDLENAWYLAEVADITGLTFCFDWDLEINVDGDRWEKLESPLVSQPTKMKG